MAKSICDGCKRDEASDGWMHHSVCAHCARKLARKLDRAAAAYAVVRVALREVLDNHAMPKTHRQGSTTLTCQRALAEADRILARRLARRKRAKR